MWPKWCGVGVEEECVKAFPAPVDPWNPGVQPVMDSADLVSSSSPPAPVTFEAILQRHEQMLVCLSEDVAALTQAATQCTPLSEPSSPSKRTLWFWLCVIFVSPHQNFFQGMWGSVQDS